MFFEIPKVLKIFRIYGLVFYEKETKMLGYNHLNIVILQYINRIKNGSIKIRIIFR